MPPAPCQQAANDWFPAGSAVTVMGLTGQTDACCKECLCSAMEWHCKDLEAMTVLVAQWSTRGPLGTPWGSRLRFHRPGIDFDQFWDMFFR